VKAFLGIPRGSPNELRRGLDDSHGGAWVAGRLCLSPYLTLPPLPSERGSEHGGLDTPLASTATIPDGLRRESEGMEGVERG